MRPLIASIIICFISGFTGIVAAQPAVSRSFERLVSSNGHVVVSYDRMRSRVDTFLEHPYRFQSPRDMPSDLCFAADETRDLAYDTYFGVRSGAGGEWVGELPVVDAGYLEGTGVIYAQHFAGPDRGLSMRTHTFAPSTLDLPVMVMTVRVENRSAVAQPVSLYALFNFRVGDAAGGREPSAEAEEASWDDTRHVFYEYSDSSQGTLAYIPIEETWRRTVSSGEAGVYRTLSMGRDLDGVERTGGPSSDVAPGVQWSELTLDPGEAVERVVGVVWAEDEDAGPLVDGVHAWVDGRSATELIRAEVAAWDTWHNPPPAGLSEAQRLLWRQSAAFLRMGQVREAGGGYGQILASLPPGLGNLEAQWNISWVRDMAYAVAGLIRAGHLEEARAAINFQLRAGPGRRVDEVGGEYRISATRYFGDGQEETDCNENGPNVEFDGFGLFLWTVGEYFRGGGDPTHLTGWWPTIRDEVASVLASLVGEDGLIQPDSSIWEVHWNGRQRRFAYTSLAAVRGLCDAASLAMMAGDADSAARFAAAGASVRDAIGAQLVDENGVLAQSAEDLLTGSGYLDAATVEAMNWGIVDPHGRVAGQTVDALLEHLTVDTGVGLMRNDDGGWYDSQEWVFVDLRLLPVLRMQGRDARADALLEWLQAQAQAHDGQFSELHGAGTGVYAGSIPMVGFGAGAYLLALSDTAVPTPACGAYLSEAPLMPPPQSEPPGADASVTPPMPPGGGGASGCGCVVAQAARPPTWVLGLGAAGCWFWVRRRRR